MQKIDPKKSQNTLANRASIDSARGEGKLRLVLILLGFAILLLFVWFWLSRPSSVKIVATASLPAKTRKSVELKACPGLSGDAVEQRVNAFLAENPAQAEMVQETWRTGIVKLGMSEEAFFVTSCSWVDGVNTTETTNSLRKQIVVRDNPVLGKYIYIENGVIVSIQK